MMFAACFGEETEYHGYMFERLGKLSGSGTVAKAAIVLLTSAWFGIGHYANQGLAGVEQALFGGSCSAVSTDLRGASSSC